MAVSIQGFGRDGQVSSRWKDDLALNDVAL
jgi:hypothetical protein